MCIYREGKRERAVFVYVYIKIVVYSYICSHTVHTVLCYDALGRVM